MKCWILGWKANQSAQFVCLSSSSVSLFTLKTEAEMELSLIFFNRRGFLSINTICLSSVLFIYVYSSNGSIQRRFCSVKWIHVICHLCDDLGVRQIFCKSICFKSFSPQHFWVVFLNIKLGWQIPVMWIPGFPKIMRDRFSNIRMLCSVGWIVFWFFSNSFNG
jgi:hypothetical protein